MVGRIVMIALLLLIGTMLSLGKWSFLIAGFNTMSKDEKENYDVLSLCKFMGKFTFMFAFFILLCVLSDVLMMKKLFNIGITLFVVSIIFVIIYTNTGNRFKKKK